MNLQNLKPNILQLSLALVSVTVIFGACLKSPDPVPQKAYTYLTLMHLAPNAPAVDVYFNDKKVSNIPLDALTVSSAYDAVDKGSFAVRFKKAASDSIVAEIPTALYDTLDFHTLLIYSLVNNGPAKAVAINDDFSPIAADLTKPYYRFFHMSPNTGNVDLYVNGNKIESNRAFADNTFQDDLNKFKPVITDILKLEVRFPGADTAIASMTNAFLQNGNAYTIYLKGLKDGTGAQSLSLGLMRAVN
jgi:hypothetical protein